MKKSVWHNGANLPEFESVNKDLKTDVLIIGGGLCGTLCAHRLKSAGIDYILVEGNRIASGITKNTSAKITSLHGLIYAKLLRSVGREQAQIYLDANQKALPKHKL